MPFSPPPASLGQLQGIPFGDADDGAFKALKAIFDAYDATPAAGSDPNKCKALLQFPGGAVFWSSKMAIDADGPAVDADHRSGTQLDPDDGQDDTKYHFPDDDAALASEAVPYIVLPGATFRSVTGLKMGDMAVVIYKDKISAAICGDLGPVKKIGEGSIRLHENFHPPAPDPCSLRDGNGFCKRILNASIEEDVLFFVFPGSAIDTGINQANVESLINEKAIGLYNALRTS